MRFKNDYWHFPSALTPRFCDEVIKYASSKKETMAKTGIYSAKKLSKEEIKHLKRNRDADVVWLEDPWIYRELHPFVKEANKKAGWNFEWDRSEPIQFTKYKQNQYYDWHTDENYKPYDRDINHPEYGKIRKLSMTCQLTDGSEYQGGELEFDFRNYTPHTRDESKHLIKCKEILPKGSIIVFPSSSWHRIKPVTKGIRYSLVLWHLGYPFK